MIEVIHLWGMINGDEYDFDLEDTSEGFAFGGPLIKIKHSFMLLMKKRL
jgi:hypothetical protein